MYSFETHANTFNELPFMILLSLHPLLFRRDETLEALSDAQVVAPAALTADLHSQDHRNSFLYVFDYQTKFGDYAQVSAIQFNSFPSPPATPATPHGRPLVNQWKCPPLILLKSFFLMSLSPHSAKDAFMARICRTFSGRLLSAVSITLPATTPNPRSPCPSP